ncbi:MAG: DUF3365 domain-containing protein [Planctomycetaceae bacterium]
MPYRVCYLSFAVIAMIAGSVLIASASDDSSAAASPDNAVTEDGQESQTEHQELQRVSIAVARDRARLMHTIYLSTLDVMHDRYFHADRAIVPARAMEDVFAEIDDQTGAKANWISVNLKAMSINHEPKTDFERKAAREIAVGKSEIEQIDGGLYRRATAIPMAGGCISCHGGLFRQQSKTEKFTGLVITIPVTADE